MTRYLYLVRHGRVFYEGNIKRCVGRSDIDLDDIGRQQAEDLAGYFKDKQLEKIYCSPLKRAKDTAMILARGQDVEIMDDLIEIDLGEWENKALKELHKDLESEPQYGEKRIDAFQRFQKAIDHIIQITTGDIVVVSHSTMNCLYLAHLLHIPLETSRLLPQPFGCFNRIEINDQQFHVLDIGIMPQMYPDEKKCYEIFSHFHTPKQVIEHCQKVTQLAMQMTDKLNKQGYHLDEKLVYSAALLHDVVRYKKNHAIEGYYALLKEGYPKVAEVICYHHDLTDKLMNQINEITVVYLADKYIQGTQFVSLKDRFEKSLSKCLNNQEAYLAHQRRYLQALTVEKKILGVIKSID